MIVSRNYLKWQKSYLVIAPGMFQPPSNRSLEEPWHSLFLAAYSLIFIVAFTLNSIMVFSAKRKIRGMFLFLSLN